ncbi:MAG: vWA domain-containing protein [Myxococcota bacterium]
MSSSDRGGAELGSSSAGAGGDGADLLTAGAWDDNRNYALFEEFLQRYVGLALPFSMEEHDAAFERAEERLRARETLDVALVVDATGSMSDELSFLQTELEAVATRVSEAYPEADARWALIMYRDQGDEYVTRIFDFDDLDAVRERLARQRAGGGGDYPEASARALQRMNRLEWRRDRDTARLAFWLADAPHHDAQSDRFADVIRWAAEQDIHLYPVASSGIDERTEVAMRSSAQLTAGRYLFLTDDSGVGDSHREPTVPCYFVTTLTRTMIRMVDIEMSGTYVEPPADHIIRNGGDPTSGACQLADGDEAYVW